ncbi:MAG: stage II sporulation protein P [Acetivibrio ethanolgignens]
MRFSKITRFVYIFIWTGIFILSSYIIVKESDGSMLEKTGESVLKRSSEFIDYYSGNEEKKPIEGILRLFTVWENGCYFYRLGSSEETGIEMQEEETEEIGLVLEYEKGNLLTPIPFIYGESYYEEDSKEVFAEIKKKNEKLIAQLKKTQDVDFLLKNFYIVDGTTSVDKKVFQVSKLLEKDMTIEKEEKPQILICHTHGGSERFSDSRENRQEDSIVGVGKELAKELEELGYGVIHDTTEYDRIEGVIDRNKAYNQSLAGAKEQLKKYPSIQVVIDLHRDGVRGKEKRVTTIDGKPTATFMMFNGLSRSRTGEIDYLKNKNLQGNLAFSLQMKLKAMELYPTLTTPNYLKGYRYNMHLCERFLLIELGNQNNTVEEAKNAMEPLSRVLDAVLQDEK